MAKSSPPISKYLPKEELPLSGRFMFFCIKGGGEGAVSSRPRQDPPTEPRHVNAVAKPMPGRVAPADYYEPHVKDQCRNVPEEGMNNSDPPLASAVVVEETIEQVAPDLPRINL